MTNKRCVLPHARTLACLQRWAVPAHSLLLACFCVWCYAVPQGCCSSAALHSNLPSVIVGKHVPFAAEAGRGARRVQAKAALLGLADSTSCHPASG